MKRREKWKRGEVMNKRRWLSPGVAYLARVGCRTTNTHYIMQVLASSLPFYLHKIAYLREAGAARPLCVCICVCACVCMCVCVCVCVCLCVKVLSCFTFSDRLWDCERQRQTYWQTGRWIDRQTCVPITDLVLLGFLAWQREMIGKVECISFQFVWQFPCVVLCCVVLCCVVLTICNRGNRWSNVLVFDVSFPVVSGEVWTLKIYIQVSLLRYVFMYVCMYLCVNWSMYVWMYVCMYLCM